MKKRRGLAALLAAAMCLSAIVPVYADEIAAEPSADVDVVTKTVDETAEVTDTDIAEGSATQADTEETESATEEVSSDVSNDETDEEAIPDVSDDEETVVSETVDTIMEDASEAVEESVVSETAVEMVEEPSLDTDETLYDAKATHSEISRQIDLLAGTFEQWQPYDGTVNRERWFDYAVTDLDHDGHIEVITSYGEGSGIYTYNHFFTVKNGSLMEIGYSDNCPERVGYSEPDLGGDSSWYYVYSDGTYKYLVTDHERFDAWNNMTTKYYMYLKNDKIEILGPLAERYVVGDYSQEPKAHYLDAFGRDISEETYEKIGISNASGRVALKWQSYVSPSDHTEDTVRELLIGSYSTFDPSFTYIEAGSEFSSTYSIDMTMFLGDNKLIALNGYDQLPKFDPEAVYTYSISDKNIASIDRYETGIIMVGPEPRSINYPVLVANKAGTTTLSVDVEEGTNKTRIDLSITVVASAEIDLQVTSERYGDKDLPITFSNELFTGDTTVFDHEFSKMSSVMAMAAYVRKGETDHCRGNLEKLGFSRFVTYGSYEKTWDGLTPDDDHYVAYTFARKDIKTDDGKKTIIAVMVKGTSKNDEWYSDFDIYENASSEGGFYHYGFKTAGDRLLVDYNKYLDSMSDLDRSNMKVWITGHSRGASVGNYIAAKITDQLSTQNVVAYVYACPNVSRSPDVMIKNKYDNIFNFNNPEDLVPCLPLRKWGYSRYGRTYIFPSNAENKANMVKEADDMAESLWGDTISGNHWSDRFATVNNIVDFMYTDFDSVNDYYNLAVVDLQVLYKILDQLPIPPLVRSAIKGVEISRIDRISMYQLIHHLAATKLGDENWADAGKMFVDDYLSLSMIFRPKNEDPLFVYNIVDFLFKDMDNAMPAFTYGHMPEVYVTWAYTLSSVEQYEEMGRSFCKYKRYAVECPVDIEIYDSSNNIIGRVVDNKVDESVTKIGIIVFEESKYFYYPADEKITIMAKGYDNGTMDYSTKLVDISDYSSTELEKIEDIPITPDTTVMIKTTEPNTPDKITVTEIIPKPTTVIKTAFGGRTVQLNCADADAEIYYQFGSSNITSACKHVKAGETIFLDEPMTGNKAAMYFKAYKNGKWSVLGKWGVLNVQIAQPLLKLRGNKYKGNFFIYTQTKNSYIVYTLDGTIPSIEEGTQKLKVKNGRLIWGTQGNINVPYGCTVKAIAIRCGLVTSDVMTYTNR